VAVADVGGIAEHRYRRRNAVLGHPDTPNGPGATTSVLSGVSCTSSSACVAVGYYVNGSSDDVVFAEAFTTTGWTILSPVIPTGASRASCQGCPACPPHRAPLSAPTTMAPIPSR